MQRRQFMQTSAAWMLLSAMGCSPLTSPPRGRYLISTASDLRGHHFVVASTLDGRLVSQTQLPLRGHETLPIPGHANRVLVLARRPDRLAFIIDIARGEIAAQFSAAPARHFYGHAAFAAGGDLLYTSENDYQHERGVIVVRDTSNYRVVAEYDSGGIGPHQLKLLPDHIHLAVANGGIHTHPDWPRLKLNVDSMQPNLAILNTHTGAVVQRYAPRHHQQSIRHLDVNAAGDIFVAMQSQAKLPTPQPLVYVQRRQQPLQPLSAPAADWQAMGRYTSSVTCGEGYLVVTSPRGNCLTLWDSNKGHLIKRITLKDAAGIATINGDIFVSSGLGTLLKGSKHHLQHHAQFANLRFDNHMSLA